MSRPPPMLDGIHPTFHAQAMSSELERERQRALFVMRYFVPPEQQQKVNLEFIMQQLRTSPIESHLPVADLDLDESSDEEWQDLMQWTNPSMLDTIESQPVHIFQWERTYQFIINLRDGFMGSVPPTPEFERQKKIISAFMRHLKAKLRAPGMNNNSNNNKTMKVFWTLWKLRGSLATIPTPSTEVAKITATVRLFGVLAELGLAPFRKLIQLLRKNPEAFLLYMVTMFWFSPA